MRRSLFAKGAVATALARGALILLGTLGSASATDEIRIADPPHHYWTRELRDPFTKFLRDQPASLAGGDEKAFVKRLLAALEVPESSQLLVFSATSLQRLVSPRHPRALYFNDQISVGWVPDGRIEVLSVDPDAGPVFFIMAPPAIDQPLRPERQERCLNCHAGLKAGRRPGFVFESVVINQQGGTLESHRDDEIGHVVPLANRFGGWHLTGSLVTAAPHANRLGQFIEGRLETWDNQPGRLFKLDRYLRPSSDGLVHLVHEHQAGFVNRVTAAAYRARELAPRGTSDSASAAELKSLAHGLVRYLLFAEEAPLPSGGIAGDPEFISDFLAARRQGSDGASLRDFDLKTRLFKHRCSYMIYTPQWAALPAPLKQEVYSELAAALKPDAPKEWASSPSPKNKRSSRSSAKPSKISPPAGLRRESEQEERRLIVTSPGSWETSRGMTGSLRPARS